MLRTTNFTSRARPRVFPVALGLWVCALSAAAASVWLMLQVADLGDNSAKLEKHIARLQDEVGDISAAGEAAPSAEEIAALIARVTFFNGLSGERRASLPVLLEALEALIPADVWISQLIYSLDTGRVALSMQAEQETQLPPALSRIEASQLLGDVILERQLRVREGRRALVQYDVNAMVK